MLLMEVEICIKSILFQLKLYCHEKRAREWLMNNLPKNKRINCHLEMRASLF